MNDLLAGPAKNTQAKIQAGKTSKHGTRVHAMNEAFEPVNILGPAEKIFKGWEFFEADFYKNIFIASSDNGCK